MGCGMSTEDKEGKARNEEIENQLKRDKMMQRNEIKMLLLGMIRPASIGQDPRQLRQS
jgi:guanine nucleotide-binding protein subunit alpha